MLGSHGVIVLPPKVHILSPQLCQISNPETAHRCTHSLVKVNSSTEVPTFQVYEVDGKDWPASLPYEPVKPLLGI